MKPKNIPASLLPLNYQIICSFKEILTGTALHLHPITIKFETIAIHYLACFSWAEQL